MFIYIFPPPGDLQPCGSTIIQFLHLNIQMNTNLRNGMQNYSRSLNESKVKHTIVNRDCGKLRKRQNALILKKR